MARANQGSNRRGARKAPRTTFRDAAKLKTKAKPKPKPAKAKAKAAPRAKAAPKRAKSSTPVRGAKRASPAKRSPEVRGPRPEARAQPTARAQPEAGTQPTALFEALGSITVPSGRLAIFDVGLVGYLPRPALEPALVTAEVPADRPLSVVGRRVGRGRFADCWSHVAVRLGEGEIAASRKLGEAGVDFARLVCMDYGALDHWQHEDSLDGKADFMFWGRDAGALAQLVGAPSTREGYGWTDLPLAEAEERAERAERLKAANRWLLATDFRPHSHHFHALSAARKSPQGAGTIVVGDARVCLFFTSWGDGVFPIFLDVDRDDRPVQVRVQLETGGSARFTTGPG